VPSSLLDFPGRVAAVVFTQGCNFRCPWCHNRALVHTSEFGAPISVEQVMGHLERRVGKLSGVVVSGGEPTLQPGLASFLRRARDLGFATKLDTNGSAPETLGILLSDGLVDFVAMDLKAPWERYDEACGVVVDKIRLERCLAILRESGVAHHLRTTDWAGFTGEERLEIERIAAGSPLVWQPFRPPNGRPGPATRIAAPPEQEPSRS